MKRILLLVLAFLATPALAGGPLIWYGSNSLDLTTSGIISSGISLKSGSYTEKLIAPTLTGNVTLTLPTSVGSNGSVLGTDGTGTLSWVGQGTAAAYTISPTAITAVGGAYSPLGHVIDANDFSGTTSQYSFFNLSANALDGNTTNAKDLTANGSPVYTTTNVVGTTNAAALLNGTTQYYSSTSSYYNIGTATSFATGGWFKFTGSWTPAAQANLIAQDGTGSGDAGYTIYVFTDGSINFAMSSIAGSYDTNLALSAPGFSSGSWHHVAIVFDYTNQLFKAYVDGKQVGSTTATNSRTMTNNAFNVGGRRNAANFAGSVEDVFMIKGYAPTADDIRKLAARRYVHSLAIGAESQLWDATWTRSDSSVSTALDGFLVSKDSNRAWLDFSGVATGAYVSAKMLNTQASTTSVSQASYDSGYLSSTPSSTIAHGLGDVPASLVVYYETTTNKFTPLYGSNFCEMDATNLYCDWTSLTVAAGSRVRIQAWAAGSMSAVPTASLARSGVLTLKAPTQSIATLVSSSSNTGGFAGSTTLYTMPAGVIWLRVRMVGGGGGGAGGGTAAGTTPGDGTASTFGSNSAGGGTHGLWNKNGGAGGTCTLSSSTGISVVGGMGGASFGNGAGVPAFRTGSGSTGGVSALGGAGSAGAPGDGSNVGQPAAVNSGSGGGGGENGGAGATGSGGGAGCFIDAIITSPSATYSYGVGDKGSAGGAGTGGVAGGAGGTGQIVIEEHYY
jgi:hypothetical protein